MRELYPKPASLPSLLPCTVILLTCGCTDIQQPEETFAEPWPAEYEAVFQEAEALKFVLQQDTLEADRLRDAGLPASPPAPKP